MTSNSYGTDERGERGSPSMYLYKNHSEVGLDRHRIFKRHSARSGTAQVLKGNFSNMDSTSRRASEEREHQQARDSTCDANPCRLLMRQWVHTRAPRSDWWGGGGRPDSVPSDRQVGDHPG